MRCRCGTAPNTSAPSPSSRCTAPRAIWRTQRPLHPHCPSKIGRRRLRHGLVHPPVHSTLPHCLRVCSATSGEGSAIPSSPAISPEGRYASPCHHASFAPPNSSDRRVEVHRRLISLQGHLASSNICFALTDRRRYQGGVLTPSHIFSHNSANRNSRFMGHANPAIILLRRRNDSAHRSKHLRQYRDHPLGL